MKIVDEFDGGLGWIEDVVAYAGQNGTPFEHVPLVRRPAPPTTRGCVRLIAERTSTRLRRRREEYAC